MLMLGFVLGYEGGHEISNRIEFLVPLTPHWNEKKMLSVHFLPSIDYKMTDDNKWKSVFHVLQITYV